MSWIEVLPQPAYNKRIVSKFRLSFYLNWPFSTKLKYKFVPLRNYDIAPFQEMSYQIIMKFMNLKYSVTVLFMNAEMFFQSPNKILV